MNIYVDVYEMRNEHEVLEVGAKARMEFSPTDGYDADKIAAFERDLGYFVETRLNDALKKGRSCEICMHCCGMHPQEIDHDTGDTMIVVSCDVQISATPDYAKTCALYQRRAER